MIKVIVSGSRFSREREIIINLLQTKMQASVDCYDCEAVPTSIIEGGKQAEIDQRVRECDWFILVANTVTCGKYTAQEWDAALNAIRGNRANKVVTVFRCVNPDASAAAQNIPEDGIFKFEDLFLKAEETGLGVQFLVDYTYRRDGLFESLKYVVSRQIELVMNSDLLMRTISSPITQITARDVYTNSYRVEAEYGFDENVYLIRQSVDGELAIKSRSHKFIIITGSPASGKTRALYEYLKLLRSNPANRYVVVNEFNLEEIAQTLKSFDKWVRATPGARSAHLEEYYFIIDQIGDILYKKENLEYFSDLYNVVVQYNGHIFATSLVEPYENLKRDQILPDEAARIHIKKLDETTDSEFNEELKKRYGNDEDWGKGTNQVIGDYIKGLRSYKDSISDSVRKSGQEKNIVAFIKAFNIINLFRKGNVWPLGLVLTVAEKIIDNEADREKLPDVLNFFKTNHILHPYSSIKFLNSWKIERGKKFAYDGEMLSMLVNPCILIKIDNDYIWQYLRTEKYALDCSDEEKMKQYMEWYCDAFFNDVPLPTLRRIITRSPALIYALKYNAGTNFVRDFVIGRIYELYTGGSEYSHEEMGEMVAYVLHRSSSLDELKQNYDYFVQVMGVDFALNEKTVAELMGFAQHKTSGIKKQLKEFLTAKGWDFSQQRISYYYHRRMIQYLDTFSEVESYMNDNVLLDPVLNQTEPDPELMMANKKHFICTVVSKCRSVYNLKKVFEWALRIGVQLDKFFLKTLVDTAKSSYLLNGRENLAMMECVCDNMTLQMTSLPTLIICFYTLKMSATFMNSLAIYRRFEQELQADPAMHTRCMSLMMESVNNYEFSYVYRFLFKDGKLQYPLHLISRNLLLERLDFNSAMVLYDLLYDSSDENSTPDIYTLCSLLKVNIDNLKSASYKRITDERFNDNKTGISIIESLIYQNLLQILHHPYTKKVTELDWALPQILICCLSASQEEYVVKNYIKPAYREYDMMKTSGKLSQTQYDERVDAWWEDKLTTAEVAVSRIKRRLWTDMDQVHTYLTSIVDKMLGTSKPVPPDVLNCYMNKLFSFNQVEHPEYNVSKETLNALRARLDSYLNERFRLPGSDTSVSKFDRIIKDEYFYPAYYRVFPEKIVVKDQDKYVIDKETLNAIPKDFIDKKLYSHILEGVAYFMGEEVLNDILPWLFSTAPNFSVYAPSKEFITKAFPGYNISAARSGSEKKKKDEGARENDLSWRFLNQFVSKYMKNPEDAKEAVKEFWSLLDLVEDKKNREPDSVPGYATLHKLLKLKEKKDSRNHKVRWTLINTTQVLDFLQIVFLDEDLPLTPTLWKSALECIVHNAKHSYDKNQKGKVAEWIEYLYSGNPNLIIDDQTTLAYRLNVSSKDKKKEILEKILSTDKFMTILDLSLIIQHHYLFDSEKRMADYMSLMKRYHELYLSMVGEIEYGETYGHFLTGCAYNWEFLSCNEQKEFIYQMSKYNRYSKSFSGKLCRMEEKYDRMVEDLKETLGVDVSHLRALKGGLPAEPNSGV